MQSNSDAFNLQLGLVTTTSIKTQIQAFKNWMLGPK